MPYSGKIDTGAAQVVIPIDVVSDLGLRRHGFWAVKAFDGKVSRLPVYLIEVHLGEFSFANVPCVACERNTVLLGRSVLNHLVITLDGPKQELVVHAA
jgi:predicted aspartyl protease